MKKVTFKYLSVLAVLLVALTSCSETQVISSWVQPDMSGYVMPKKVLVFALLGKQDNVTQEQFESAMVAELYSRGIPAVSAFAMFGPDKLKDKDSNEIGDIISQTNCSDVITMTLYRKDKDVTYVPGGVFGVGAPWGPWHGPWHHHGPGFYGLVAYPGYFTTDTNYIVETRLYSVNNETDAVYVVQTESPNPDGISEMAYEVASEVVSDMADKGLMPKATKRKK